MNTRLACPIMSIALAEMTLHHYDDLIALWDRCEGLGNAETYSELETFLNRNPACSMVAHHGQTMVGAAMCGHDGRRGYLYHVAVAPDYRNSGVGKSLVERCMQQLRRLGIVRCSIHLYSENDTGEAFWSRIGWRLRTDLKVMAFDLPCS